MNYCRTSAICVVCSLERRGGCLFFVFSARRQINSYRVCQWGRLHGTQLFLYPAPTQRKRPLLDTTIKLNPTHFHCLSESSEYFAKVESIPKLPNLSLPKPPNHSPTRRRILQQYFAWRLPCPFKNPTSASYSHYHIPKPIPRIILNLTPPQHQPRRQRPRTLRICATPFGTNFTANIAAATPPATVPPPASDLFTPGKCVRSGSSAARGVSRVVGRASRGAGGIAGAGSRLG